jgi:pimeloyl-ACP methyl ester carboxylesterase
VFTPTTLGHRGGQTVRARTTLTDLVDATERQLDDAGLDRPHIAGHSPGGYLAIELARRGRAQTVTAVSPAGFWSAGDGTAQLVMRGVHRSARVARFAGPAAKIAVGTARGRRTLMGAAVRRSDAMTAAAARAVIDDQAGCTLAGHLFVADDDCLAPLNPLPCPVTVAWAEYDEVLPLADYRAAVRARLPGARLLVLPGVGHAAMVDDPDRVVRTILEVTGVP